MDKLKESMVYNFLCDLKKKEISPIDRANMLQEYLEAKCISQRQLARDLGIPHSTIQDWLKWASITKPEYDDLKEQGYTHEDIYHSLRDGTLSGKDKEIDKALENCISKLQFFKIRPPYSSKTINLIGELKRILKVIETQVK